MKGVNLCFIPNWLIYRGGCPAISPLLCLELFRLSCNWWKSLMLVNNNWIFSKLLILEEKNDEWWRDDLIPSKIINILKSWINNSYKQFYLFVGPYHFVMAAALRAEVVFIKPVPPLFCHLLSYIDPRIRCQNKIILIFPTFPTLFIEARWPRVSIKVSIVPRVQPQSNHCIIGTGLGVYI